MAAATTVFMVLTFGFAQALHKGSDPKAHRRWRGGAQESNGRQLRRLLRACRERPRGGPPRRGMKSRRLMSNIELFPRYGGPSGGAFSFAFSGVASTRRPYHVRLVEF